MPAVVRGSVYWCDFGPNVGRELSDSHPALVISNSRLNSISSTAIVLPMSSAGPADQHLSNYVLIADVNSWASVRQIKSVREGQLGDKIGEASSLELEMALQLLATRLAITRKGPSSAQEVQTSRLIEPGTIWDVEVFDEHDNHTAWNTPMLILDYNDGNNIAIAVEVRYEQREGSPIRIPIEIADSETSASALIHNVRSVDLGARHIDKIGAVSESSLALVLFSLFDAIYE